MSSQSSGKLTAVEFAPGINKNNTSYENENTFVEADKVRFRKGRPEKLSGWVDAGYTEYADASVETLEGVARISKSFVDLDSVKYIAFGTNEKVKIVKSNQIYDITPIATIETLVSAISTSAGSTLISIYYPGHNKEVGDKVILDGPTTVGGASVRGEFTLTSVINTNEFTLETGSTATSSLTSAGTSVELSFLYAHGDADNGLANGYGAGRWGTVGVSGYGEPRSGSIITKLRLWSIDTWGEDLLMVPRGGPLYHWDATDGVTPTLFNGSDVRASVVDTAPATNSIVFVASPERHAVLLGSEDLTTSVFDPLLVRWSDREDFTDWTPVSSNASGSFRLTGGSKIVGYQKTRRETIIFTDQSTISMSYIGAPFYYKFNNLTNSTGLISQNASAEVDGVVYWMGANSFYKYDGVVKKLDCSLSDYIFKDDPEGSINRDQDDKIFAGIDKTYDEIIWFYPSGDNVENSRYVIYNYKENVWYDGTIVRTTWESSDIFEKPYATSRTSADNSSVWVHDTGTNDGSNSMSSYLQTGYFDISDGDEVMFLNQVIPDFTMSGDLTMYLKARREPFDQNVVTKGPYTFDNTKRTISVRARGREISLKFESNQLNSDYRFGKLRINPVQDGMR